MINKKRVSIIILLCTVGLLSAQTQAKQQVSMVITDLDTKQIVVNRNGAVKMTPASITKLITTATALEILGDDFRFKTEILVDGTINKGRLNGNLIIKAGGDPVLGSSYFDDTNFLNDWASAVKAFGISEIHGDIVADVSVFDNNPLPRGWGSPDVGNYYAAGIYGLSFLDNSLAVYFRSGRVGTKPQIIGTFPKIDGFKIYNHITSQRGVGDKAYFSGLPYENHRKVGGFIEANTDSFLVKADMPNPPMVLIKAFKDTLQKHGVLQHGKLKVSHQNVTYNRTLLPVFASYSVPLSDIVSVTNVYSNNMTAEYLLKYLSLQKHQQGSSLGGVEVIKEFWESRGLDFSSLSMYDGSGLTRYNRFSALFLNSLLVYMAKESRYADVFFESLPVAGVNGTVRNLLKNTELSGTAYLKSGSMSKVQCYAGYIIYGNKKYSIVVMVNNYAGKRKDTVAMIEKMVVDSFKGL